MAVKKHILYGAVFFLGTSLLIVGLVFITQSVDTSTTSQGDDSLNNGGDPDAPTNPPTSPPTASPPVNNDPVRVTTSLCAECLSVFNTLKEAIDYVEGGGLGTGGEVTYLVNSGEFELCDKIDLSTMSSVRITGNGKDNTKITCAALTEECLFQVSTDSFTLSDLTLYSVHGGSAVCPGTTSAASSVSISNVKFFFSVYTTGGAAVRIRENEKLNVVIDNCEFLSATSSSTGTSSDRGSAVKAAPGGDITIRNSYFTTSRGKYGGVIYFEDAQGIFGNLLIENCEFNDNYVFDERGPVDIVHSAMLPLTIRDTKFIGRKVNFYQSGSVTLDGGDTLLERCEFDGYSTDTNRDGVLFINGARVTITETVFRDVRSSAAIRIDSGDLTVVDSSFFMTYGSECNNIKVNGGASSLLNITNCDFRGNTSTAETPFIGTGEDTTCFPS